MPSECNVTLADVPPPVIPPRPGNRRPHTRRLKQESSISFSPTPARTVSSAVSPGTASRFCCLRLHRNTSRKEGKKKGSQGTVECVWVHLWKMCTKEEPLSRQYWFEVKPDACFAISYECIKSDGHKGTCVLYVNLWWQHAQNSTMRKNCVHTWRHGRPLHWLNVVALNEAVWLRLRSTTDEINESESLVSIGLNAQHNLKSWGFKVTKPQCR